MKIPAFFMILLALFALNGCSSDEAMAPQGTLLPLPGDIEEPDDAALHVAVRSYLQKENAPASSVYKFVREDLNGDRRRDALVLFKNPYGYWCDFYGCKMLVLKANNKDFSVVNTVQRIREPLYISEKTSNGWKDIIIRVSGRWSKTKDVMLEFDGRTYPSDPEKVPPVIVVNPTDGRRVFAD